MRENRIGPVRAEVGHAAAPPLYGTCTNLTPAMVFTFDAEVFGCRRGRGKVELAGLPFANSMSSLMVRTGNALDDHRYGMYT